jgi:purine-binding chemotaxis protein CheW
MTRSGLYATFHIDQSFYGVPIEDVQEVLFSQPLSQVPLAPAAVAGLLNLRGRIVTVLDLRRLLHDASAHDEAMNMVMRLDDSEVSLLIDQIGDVIRVDESTVEGPPPTLQGQGRDFIRGVYPLADGLLLLLDTSRLLADSRCHQASLLEPGIRATAKNHSFN